MQLACSSTNEAAPPFAVFERWAPPTSSFVLIRRSSHVDSAREPKFTSAKSPEYIVRGTHPSKTAKGGAASVVVVHKVGQGLHSDAGVFFEVFHVLKTAVKAGGILLFWF